MLSPDDFHVPDDADALRMENELLALENSLLRGAGAGFGAGLGAEEAVNKARQEEREKGRAEVHRIRAKYEADTAERRARFASVPHERLERLQKAESDLRWLVQRLDGSPVGPVLRRWDGWRTLRDRWSR